MFIERVLYDRPFVVTMLQRLVDFYNTLSPTILAVKKTLTGELHHSSMSPRGFDGSEFETLFPADFCQSRILGRNGSNACTIISCPFVKKVLSEPELITSANSRKDALESAMLEGKELYNKHVQYGYLSVDEVLSSIKEVQL